MSSARLNKPIERLIRRGTGAIEILDVEVIQEVWGGNGEVLRVQLSGAPQVVVKKILMPAGAKKKKRKDKGLERTLLSYDNELSFYENYASRLPTSSRTPQFFAGQRLEDSWVFVLEDLGESGFFPLGKGANADQIRAALRWLAGLHASFLGQPSPDLWKAGSYWNLASREAERSKMVQPRLKGAADSLDQAINSAKFRTVIHGDAKLDNFCFSEGMEAVGVDFQYAGAGCAMKDVMCLLDSSLDPWEASAFAPEYLDYYFEQFASACQERGAVVDSEAVESEWRALYSVAWADFYRFLDGWAPGKYPPEAYVAEQVQEALHYLAHRAE